MDISKYLSKVIGIYLILVSFIMYLNLDKFILSAKALTNNEPLMFVLGFITLLLGILMVVAHNRWLPNWRLLVTVIAWLILFKGILMLALPQLMEESLAVYLSHMNMSLFSGCELAIGLLFLYLGFKGT